MSENEPARFRWNLRQFIARFRNSRTASMPRNRGQPTAKDLLTELAAREDGVVIVQGSISGIAGSARRPPGAARPPRAAR